ncbi:MAG: hypothetical protein WBP26_00685 [Candidatus Saccharimonadales bacterium]
MAKYCLSIDESGTPSPTYLPEHPYTLVGCAIDEEKREALSLKADELKKKYWKRTDVIIHHKDLAKCKNEFSIFAGKPVLKEEFKKDLLHFLNTAPVNVFVASVDKQQISSTWKQGTVIRKTARAVFFDYIAFLYTRKSPHGNIIIEASDSTKDKNYLDAFTYFLSPACPHLDIDFSVRDIKNVVTSVMFVTKMNNDNETQIADILGYAANCLFNKKARKKTYGKGSYELLIIKALEAKMFKIQANLGMEKQKFAKKIKGHQIIV